MESPEKSGGALRVLVMGAGGQVGTELCQRLSSLATVFAGIRNTTAPDNCNSIKVDLSDPRSIARAFDQSNPDLVVNAAAYTAFEKAEKEPQLVHAINILAPTILAQECDRRGASLIHYSSDYVYDGKGHDPLTELATPAPLSTYGRSKWEGDLGIMEHCRRHIILRVQWVYGTARHSFVEAMLRLGSERDQLKVVNDQFGSPTSALTIAEKTTEIIRNATSDLPAFFAEHCGVYHLTNAGFTSWHEFASVIHSMARAQGLALRCKEIVPVSTEQYGEIARRPKNTRLSTEKITKAFPIRLQDWHADLERHMPRFIKRILS